MKIAVIPARGGSKRIVGKNVRSFAGKPLIAYSLAAAKESQLFDEIIVTTDSLDIAEISLEYGATYIVERPQELSDDFVGTFPVVQHAIETYQSRVGQVEYVCCIYATAPFLSASKLEEGFALLSQAPAQQFAFSVASFAFPIQRAIRLYQSGVEPIDASQMGKRSQDLEECYHDAGQFYWGRTNAYLDNLPMFAEHSIPVILPRYLVQDIDTPEDWERAELMYRAYVAKD